MKLDLYKAIALARERTYAHLFEDMIEEGEPTEERIKEYYLEQIENMLIDCGVTGKLLEVFPKVLSREYPYQYGCNFDLEELKTNDMIS